LNTLSDSARKTLFPRGPSLGLKFLLFAALSIAMMIRDHHGDTRLQPVRAWTARALQPLLWAAALPRGVLDLGDHFRGREDLLADNQALRQKQLELEARMLRMEALEAENARIRELLSSAASLQTRVLIAEILRVNTDAYRQVVLNKGERDGVYQGQAVVDANGIMGQVTEVDPGSSVALLITGLDGSVPVEINRTGLQTIARGRGDGQTLTLPFLPGNADIKVGDLLVSSGLGGVFPPGYPVGKISELRHPAGENFMEGIAYPSARLNQGHQVLLVWAERPPQPAAPQAAAEHPPEHPADSAPAAHAANPARRPEPPRHKPAPPAAAPAAAPAPAPAPAAAPAADAAPQ
jgi:rod shape-determining protein MreC